MPDSILRARGLSKRFIQSNGLFRPKSTFDAVADVDLDIFHGETLSFVGESGCGKSTLLRLLMRLIEPTTGTIQFEGTDLMGLDAAALRRKRAGMQMVFQDPFASLDPRMTVGALLDEPLRLHRRGSAAERRERVRELLLSVGLDASHMGRYPHEFSGGQRQRIAIARSLALRPRLILADEPVSALDVSVRAQILNLLKDLQDQFNISYLIVSHDLGVVRYVSDRIAVMYAGRIVETGTSDELFEATRHPYTRKLIAATPGRGLQRSQDRGPEGLDLDRNAPTAGCPFHLRCQYVQARCRFQLPPLTSVTSTHSVACHFHADVARSPAVALAHCPKSSALELRLDVLSEKRFSATTVKQF